MDEFVLAHATDTAFKLFHVGPVTTRGHEKAEEGED